MSDDAVKKFERWCPPVGGWSSFAILMQDPTVRSAFEGILDKTAHKHPELLRCPNCGSMDSQRDKTEEGAARIFCGRCGFTVVREMPKSAETEWNHLPGRTQSHTDDAPRILRQENPRELVELEEAEILKISPTPWKFECSAVIDAKGSQLFEDAHNAHNARLIAAAPDLYKAARNAHKLLSSMIVEGFVTEGFVVREELLNAIKKAGGEE